MVKEFEVHEILNAVDSISKIDKKKNKTVEKNDTLTLNNQAKSNKSEILVLDQMIEQNNHFIKKNKMIIQCESCSKKFVAKDSDIPKEGRVVQCGYCSVTWHQMPIVTSTKITRQKNIKKSLMIQKRS